MRGDWLAHLLSWWPFIMLVGAWLLITRFGPPRTASGASMIEICEQQEQQVAEMRRTNAALEKAL